MPGSRKDQPVLVVFVVGGRMHAIDAASVVEIAPAVTITPLMSAPPDVEGMIDYRGRLVPVVELGRKLGGAHEPLAITNHLIIARTQSGLLALRVDRVLDLVEAKPAEVEDLVRLESGLVVIHDAASILSSDDRARVEKAMHEHAC